MCTIELRGRDPILRVIDVRGQSYRIRNRDDALPPQERGGALRWRPCQPHLSRRGKTLTTGHLQFPVHRRPGCAAQGQL